MTALNLSSLHVATVRQFDPATGIATVVVPGLYGDVPIEARPFLVSATGSGTMATIRPGDSVIVFYDGGNPMTVLRWYVTAGDRSATPPAYVGPRGDFPSQAQFGHVNEIGTSLGFISTGYGQLHAIVSPTGAFSFWTSDAAGLETQFANFAANRANVNGWGLGDHPSHGVNDWLALFSIASQQQLHGADYTLLAGKPGTAQAGWTLFNAWTRAEVRVSNQTRMYADANGSTGLTGGGAMSLYGTSLNLTAASTQATINAGQKVALQLNGADILSLATDGWIRLGYSADFTYDCNVNRDVNVARNMQVNGSINCNNVVGSGVQMKTARGYASDSWPDAMCFLYQTASTMANITLHVPGVAPMIRSWRDEGEQIQFVNNNNTGLINCRANQFIDASTITAKRDVRPLRPEREYITASRTPLSDTVVTPDIMGLRPVVFRPKVPALRIVPAPGLDEYTADDPDTWETVPQDPGTPLGIQGTRERLGLIAEEVQHVVPSAVTHDIHGDAIGIHYSQITVALLDHVQELTRTVETLRYRIAELEDAR